MATRSSSNKGVTGRNTNVMYAPPNTQDTTQAVRRIPGVDYGEQKALTEQQQAAPLASAPTTPSRPMGQPQPQLNRDVFRPTDVPGESPLTAGVNPAEAAPDNTLLALKAMLHVSGYNPVISQLIHNYQQRGV